MTRQLLDKENHKFQYKIVESGSRAQKYYSSVEWLIRAEILLKKSYPMYYYKNDTTKKEIDFLIQRDGCVIPIEVKSGNSKAISLNQLMKKQTEIPIAYRLHDGNVGIGENRIISMPLYMAMFL